jgi:D-sedoheptulose 7-phosphate isomerase
LGDVGRAFELLKSCYEQGGKLMICGSGGSAADSEHIVGELMKGFKLKRSLPEAARVKLTEAFPQEGAHLADQLQGALPALSLVSQTALITAVANDVDADLIYAQQVYGYGRPGDALLGISTSGNSANILHALRVARTLGLHTVGLTGRGGGEMKALCDVTICVPEDETLQIQERHLPVYHALCELLEQAFFG